jgi:pyruvate dehydrogenase E1 component alpha subunit
MKFDQEKANRLIYLCRQVDEGIVARYDQGPDGKMKTPTHLSTGQEAVAVGVIMALPSGAHVFSTHRNHAHYLAKGGDLDAMIAEIYGKATGCCGGRGGSMHLIDESAGFMGGYPIVGDAISLATGSALAAKLDDSQRVTVVFFGDGAVESGQLWESFNFARAHDLHLLYVCENNGLATQTPIEERQPDGLIWQRVFSAVGTANREITGNVGAIHSKTLDLLGKLPAFLEVPTVRYRQHVGPRYAWEGGRPLQSDIEQQMGRDPLKGLSYPDIDERVAAAFERAEAAPWPEAGA